MLGLFINTLPVRVALNGKRQLLEWLGSLQQEDRETLEFQYTPLSKIQGWCGLGRGQPLFESLFVFENYPRGRKPPEPVG